jgi:hypothetical protein
LVVAEQKINIRLLPLKVVILFFQLLLRQGEALAALEILFKAKAVVPVVPVALVTEL